MSGAPHGAVQLSSRCALQSRQPLRPVLSHRSHAESTVCEECLRTRLQRTRELAKVTSAFTLAASFDGITHRLMSATFLPRGRQEAGPEAFGHLSHAETATADPPARVSQIDCTRMKFGNEYNSPGNAGHLCWLNGGHTLSSYKRGLSAINGCVHGGN